MPLETREALAQMSEQHVRFERELEDVLPLWEALARDGSRLAAMPSWFGAVATRLREELEEHLALEEETIYPAVRHYLSADSEAVILREMRGRRRQYESELRLFRAGLATVFLVLQRQSDMVVARRRALRAEIDLVRSIARFEAATGQTLEVHGVVVERVR